MARWTAKEVAERLSQGGAGKSKKCGNSWKVCCPAHGEKRPSMSLMDGRDRLVWKCHVGCSQEDVQRAIEDVMGGKMPTERSGPKPATAKDQIVIQTLVPPEDVAARVRPEDFYHFAMGTPSVIWIYRTADGRVHHYVARYDTDGGKEMLPWTWCKVGSQAPAWKHRAKPDARPLYNLDELTRRPNDPVLYVEGEKAADAAAMLFPAWVVTTHSGGSNALEKADLSPLTGRRVIIMPDADAPGAKMMQQLARLITGKARMIHELVWSSHRIDGTPYVLEEGDDAADHLASGWTREELKACMDRGHRLIPTLDYVENFGEDRGSEFRVFVNDGQVFLTHRCGDKDVPVHGMKAGWSRLVEIVEAEFNLQLRKVKCPPGRFPRTNGEIVVYEYFALQLLSLFKELDGRTHDDLVERWLSWSPYLRMANGKRILGA